MHFVGWRVCVCAIECVYAFMRRCMRVPGCDNIGSGKDIFSVKSSLINKYSESALFGCPTIFRSPMTEQDTMTDIPKPYFSCFNP